MIIDAVVWFFVLGVIARLAKSDLRLPEPLYETLSIYLLLAIGLKGGVELARQPVASVLPSAVAAVALGAAIPLALYPVLRWIGRLSVADSASIAAHYGSVSVVTFAVATSLLLQAGISSEPHMPLLVALMEAPGIVVGIVLARALAHTEGSRPPLRWGALAHEVLLGKSVVLLLGGLAIGWLAGPEGSSSIEPLFFDLFKGILALFLLEMGLIAAAQLPTLRQHGLFIVLFGVAVPVAFAFVGAGLGHVLGLSPGGITVLATLAASASYIAAPAAIRTAVPEANPALSLTAALAVTFPFNIVVGIPLYERIAAALAG